MILSKEHEAKLQPEETDNMGFDLVPDEYADIPPEAEFQGAISESLWRHLQEAPLRIEGLSEVTGKKCTVEISLSGGYISAETIVFGHSTGRRFCIAWQTKEGRWFYTKKMIDALENGYPTPTDEDPNGREELTTAHWKVMVHTYIRV